jgi:proton-dependent oligopeptide transporter, POT family
MSDPKAAAVDPRLERIRNFEGKYPKEIWGLFLSEMWERFCFYGMRAMLTVFMIRKLGFAEGDANLRYGAIQSFVYAMTFAGGFFADKFLGFRRSITWGGLLMSAGSFTVAYDPEQFFFIGTAISIVGTGFFKPNISGVVGLLYKDGDPRRDAGFSLFYSGINIGAMIGGGLCGYLGKTNGNWNLSFGIAGVAILLGVAIFAFTAKNLEPLGHSPLLTRAKSDAEHRSGRLKIGAVYLGSLAAIPLILAMVKDDAKTDLFMKIVGPGVLVYFAFEMKKYGAAWAKKMLAALVYILFSMMFWAIFEQAGGSLAIVAADLVAPIDGIGVAGNPNVVNDSSNSVFVIAFAPLFGLLWLKMARREPDTTVKFGLGFLFLGVGFYVFKNLIGTANDAGQASLYVFATGYLFVTFGELCLSPIGLSAMTKLAPKKLFGIMMGLWFLASAYGQYFAGLFGAAMGDVKEGATPREKLAAYSDGYGNLAIYAAACGVALLLLSPLMKKLISTPTPASVD